MLEQSLAVLLVEDNPGDARLIREMLREGCGNRCKIQHVERLNTGLAHLSDSRTDVVLLDLSLPDSQGFDTFVRVHDHAPTIPIVILTGLDDEALARRAVQEGAQDYLPKGDINAHWLVRSILYAVERARGEAERARLLASEQAAHEAAEAQRARLEAVLQNAAHGIMFIDAGGGHLSANAAAVRLFGRQLLPEGGVAQYGGQVCRPDGEALPVEELPLNRALQDQGAVDEELLLHRADASDVPVLCSSTPIRDSAGEIVGAVAVFQDITPIKELDRMREEWTSVIAHDLRQPVSAISFYAQALGVLAERDAALERIQPRARSIVDATRRLDRMVSDLLDVSRLAAGRLRIDPVRLDLSTLVRGVVERLAEQSDSHLVEVNVHEQLPPVAADPGRLEQVLGNLVSNAMKYGDPGAPINVHVRRSDGFVEVAVTNYGEGIPAPELSNLFSRFYRSRAARSGDVPGLGLGLYIARELVQAHGGRIWVESVPGQTTSFRFALPIDPEA